MARCVSVPHSIGCVDAGFWRGGPPILEVFDAGISDVLTVVGLSETCQFSRLGTLLCIFGRSPTINVPLTLLLALEWEFFLPVLNSLTPVFL